MLTDISLVLSSLHTLGAALGALGVTFAELAFLHGMVTGALSRCEQRHIRATFWSLRFGLFLVLITGIALTYVEYFLPDSPQQVLFAPFWAMQALTLFIILWGWLLSRRLIPFAVGSAGAFTAWWMLLFLELSLIFPATFFSLVMSYGISTIIIIGLFSLIRGFAHAHTPRTIVQRT